MTRLLVTVLSVVLIVLSGCASNSDNNSELGISADVALKAMDNFATNPVGQNAKAYLSIAMNYVEKNDDTYVVIDNTYFPKEYVDLHIDNRSHLLGAYVAGNARYQLRNGVVENRPEEGIRLMLFTYRALVNAGMMRQYPSFNAWLQNNGAI